MRKSSFLIVTAFASAVLAEPVSAAKCLFISSYHQGYAWSDGVERGLRSVLEGRCELRQFDMDTKRNKDEAYKKKVGLEAKELIETWQPDVVITADDNAAKYIIKPYFRDAKTPFVFGGVNWTAKEYGFPYSNVTGMVEVAPIKPMLKHAVQIAGGGTRVFYIGADTLTEKKNLKRFENAARLMDLQLDHSLVGSVDEWVEAYAQAQNTHDVIVVGSHSGIPDWDKQSERVEQQVAAIGRRISVTNHGWMMPYSMFGMTKVPDEHGEWTAKTALAILDGVPPAEIPIVANRKWDLWVNDRLLVASGVELPRGLRRKAKSMD